MNSSNYLCNKISLSFYEQNLLHRFAIVVLLFIFLLRSASLLDITLYFMFSELPDFLSDEECDHIIELAEMFGLEGSIMHTDEYQEKHRKEVKGTIEKGLNGVNHQPSNGLISTVNRQKSFFLSSTVKNAD